MNAKHINEGGGLLCWNYPNGSRIQRRLEDKPFVDHSKPRRLYYVFSKRGQVSHGFFDSLKAAQQCVKGLS